MLLSYCAGDGILLLFFYSPHLLLLSWVFPLVWKTLTQSSFVSGEEKFREFHLSPVGFLFLVCNSPHICWLFGCLKVPELLWQTPPLGGGSKSQCWGPSAEMGAEHNKKRAPSWLVHDSPGAALLFNSFNISRGICEILLTFPQWTEIFIRMTAMT